MKAYPSPVRRRAVLTYGTFDLFHVGHVNLLRRLKALGDYLIVAVSTDEFNRGKGKETIIRFEDRIEIVRSCRYVDLAIPETRWEQKIDDVKHYDVSIFAMGDDWAGKFDFLKEYCEVVYLPRTANISSTSLKTILSSFNKPQMEQMKAALDAISAIVANFDGARPRVQTPPASQTDPGSVLVLPHQSTPDLRQSA
ncbi:MAG TPA: glycerol-3-phosphate cytidylyltransferase [Opitutaceae bacterium]|nr:glycerol-3-phosphate cytidylyltransferase [Opitutaceae bacterium]